MFDFLVTNSFTDRLVTGSLGARITELKQKVIAENPRRYGLAVPRKFFHSEDADLISESFFFFLILSIFIDFKYDPLLQTLHVFTLN